MPHFVSVSEEKGKLDVSDICSDFNCLKVSVMQKASRISGKLDQVTIGPDSTFSFEDSNLSENIENEKNSCNLPEAKKNSKSANFSSSRSGLNFSIKKILHENEVQRKETVRQKMEMRRQEMERSARAWKKDVENYQSILALKRQQEKREDLARLEAEEERQAQQSEMRRKHEQQLLAQRIQEQKERLERDAEEQRKKIRERSEAVEKIQINFHERWRDFEALTHSCRDKYSIGPYIAKVNELSAHMETIGNAARAGRLTSADLEVAEMVVQDIDEVLRLFQLEIERINAMYDAKIAQREQELKQAEIMAEIAQLKEENRQVTNEIQASAYAVPETEVTDSGNSGNSPAIAETAYKNEDNQPVIELYKLVDKESLKLYVQSKDFLEKYLESYKDLLKSTETKIFRFECQKAINIPVNAISAMSREHLLDKYKKLRDLLTGKFSQDPRAEAFCKNTLAKKIVSQGETLVSSKPEMAFAIAAVVVALWNDSPEFGELLLANFRVTCPFIVPAFFPQGEGQSNEDYYKSLGYKYSEDGTVERQDKFLKRISGLLRLYASIVVTVQRREVTRAHPHGLQNAWRWLAAMLNNEPRPEMSDVCATLILDMLEVTGNALWSAYPKQFPKLLSAMKDEYYSLMGKIGGIGGGPMARLEEFLEKCRKHGFIEPPEGLLSPDFW
ncbi:nucleoporin Gle1 [Belonocnema kinseyi]|uniref:nucleoporin Gle1 n=1 Tax=Belonocnema kinseyi TaxID=2817044 RepID=UPI00143D9924|nr:nucleoporin Gle1 [Belonocnema kinseyi]